jgi:hypothetical protein
MGASAHVLLDKYKDQVSNLNILEIGAEPLFHESGDGSTKYFADFVQSNPSATLTSIDLNTDMYEGNIEYIEEHNLQRINCYNTDYTNIVEGKYGFIYLDNFDYLPPGCETDDWCVRQQQTYIQEYGVECTNENSAKAHLEQAWYLQDYVADRCVILFDDTFLIEQCGTHEPGFQRGRNNGFTYPESGWYGKGATAVPWLMDNGWTLFETYAIGPRDDWTALCNW